MAEEIIEKVEEESTVVPDAETKETPDPKVEGDEGVDYDAELKIELEKTKKRLDQAEHKIIALKSKKESAQEDEEEDETDVKSEIEKIRNENKTELDKIRLDLVKDTVSDVLSSLSSNPAERELIRFNYENKIVKSGFDRQAILEDLTLARLLANRSKLEKTISELKYTLDSEKGKNKGGSATGQDMDKKTVKLTDQEESWVKQTAARMKVPEDVVRAKLIANKS